MDNSFCCDVKPQQPRVLKLWIFLYVFISLFLVFSYGEHTTNVNIGAIIDADSRIGREEKTAMEIAVQVFNDNNIDSNHQNLSFHLHIQDSGRDPLLAATAGN